jgi:DUF4097 and DUF4098 domain-containing protein YvlB
LIQTIYSLNVSNEFSRLILEYMMSDAIRQPISVSALASALLSGTLLVILSTQAVAGDVIRQSLAAPADAIISINNIRGDVTLKGWEQADVEITGELDDLAEKLVFKVKGNHVIIEVQMPSRDVNWGDGSDLTIHVPVLSRVKFVGVSSDVSAKDIQGGLQLQTVSGDIFAHEIGSQLMVSTVSGEIEVDGSTGRLRASAISGDLHIESAATDATFETVSGHQRLMLQHFDQASVRSVSGDVMLSGHLSDGGVLDITSVSGDIDVGLQSLLNATVKAVAGFGGAIDNGWNDGEVDDSGPMGERLKTVVGDGSAEVSLRGVSADITLTQDD